MITITIPTYWTRPAGESGHPDDSIFDHPTPLDRHGTLRRCLDSIKRLKDQPFQVLIITAPVNQELSEPVEERIEKMIAPYKKCYPICQFGPSDLLLVKTQIEKQDFDPSMVSLDAYANIRNCQLLGSVLLKSDLIAGVDDDEVVPEDYLVKACAYAGRSVDNRSIHGVAGVYLDADGSYKIKESPDARNSSNVFTKKTALMNDEISFYMSSPENIVETSIALGGNMIFSRDLFMKVSFDPGITRGEDIDYLLNSRMMGYKWFFDKELFITHIPPKAEKDDPLNTSPYSKLQQDIIRFIYQKEKIKLSTEISGVTALSAEDFGLYPGEFFKDNLEEHALETLKSRRPPSADESFFPLPEKLIEKARKRAVMARQFIPFNEKWKQLMHIMEKDRILSEHMAKKVST